MPIQSYTLSDR